MSIQIKLANSAAWLNFAAEIGERHAQLSFDDYANAMIKIMNEYGCAYKVDSNGVWVVFNSYENLLHFNLAWG